MARTACSSWRVRGAGAHLNPRRAGPGQGCALPLATGLTISGLKRASSSQLRRQSYCEVLISPRHLIKGHKLTRKKRACSMHLCTFKMVKLILSAFRVVLGGCSHSLIFIQRYTTLGIPPTHPQSSLKPHRLNRAILNRDSP